MKVRLKDIKVGSQFRKIGTLEINTVTRLERVRDKFGNVKTWIHMDGDNHGFGIKTDLGCINTYWKPVIESFEGAIMHDAYLKGEF